jgi:hypothetical protein
MQKRHYKLPEPPPPREPALDLRTLMRLGLWGGAAAGALLIVAIATGSDTGQRRLSLAYGAITGSTQIAAAEAERRFTDREREMATETRRLTESLRNLSEDRDRLLVRMTALERNYEDVTGSIGRLANPPKPPVEATPTPPAAPPADLAPVATVPVPAAPADLPEATPARTEFGVDLGGGPSIASLRAAWNQIRRNHGALLDGLRPVVGVRDGRASQTELRLIVGPIGNAATAAKLCATLAAAGLSCQPTTFEGQRLALR